MNALTQHQVASNTESRGRWREYAGHRGEVTHLLRNAAPAPPARLCVLGAGNCNDLDLPALRAAYTDICLVDLDSAALARGALFQGVADDAAIRCVGGVDATGMLDVVAGWTAAAGPADAELAACAEAPLRRVVPLLPAPFDVVVSACMLTQILHGVVQAIGPQHACFVPSLQALRTGHLRLMSELAAPGGTGVLITDIVSTDSLPALATTPDDALPALLVQAIQAGNFFHGVNPAAIAAFLRNDPAVAGAIADIAAVPPWRWDFGPRVYAVYACTFRKRRAPAQ